jgi:DNA polymerase elongation subunit (family B)
MAAPSFYLTQMVPKSFQSVVCSATGSQINSIMIRAYLQEAHSLPKESPAVEFEGAISMGNSGLYKNAFKIDVSSLYPSIMMAYKVYDESKDPEGKFLELVETLTKERLKNKALAKTDKYYDDLQSSQKITINSCYGFLAAQGLLFNSPSKAAFITRTGREILQRAFKWAEEKKFTLINGDTDSIMFCKEDQSEFSENEQNELLTEINGLFPSQIHFEHDGIYPSVLILKAKNYALWDGQKLKIKGSALKGGGKEMALKELMNEVLHALIASRQDFREIYDKYVKEALNISQIKRWSAKKTITPSVMNPERLNEQKVLDAINGSDYAEGDKVWVYFKSDNTLELAENFKGDYNRNRMLAKLYKTMETFENVLDVKELLPNYSLKRNKKLLELL